MKSHLGGEVGAGDGNCDSRLYTESVALTVTKTLKNVRTASLRIGVGNMQGDSKGAKGCQ